VSARGCDCIEETCLSPLHEIVVPNSGRWGGQSRTVDTAGLRRLRISEFIVLVALCFQANLQSFLLVVSPLTQSMFEGILQRGEGQGAQLVNILA
jgi:hypothetical protein